MYGSTAPPAPPPPRQPPVSVVPAPLTALTVWLAIQNMRSANANALGVTVQQQQQQQRRQQANGCARHPSHLSAACPRITQQHNLEVSSSAAKSAPSTSTSGGEPQQQQQQPAAEPEPAPAPTRSMVQSFKQFCEETTFHGFAELGNASCRALPLWSLLILAMTAITAFEIYIVINDYHDNLFTTSYDPVVVQSMSIPPVKIYPRVVMSPLKAQQMLKRLPEIVIKRSGQTFGAKDLGIMEHILAAAKAFYWDESDSVKADADTHARKFYKVHHAIVFDSLIQDVADLAAFELFRRRTHDEMQASMQAELAHLQTTLNASLDGALRMRIERVYRSPGLVRDWHMEDVAWLTVLNEIHQLHFAKFKKIVPCYRDIMRNDAFAVPMLVMHFGIIDCVRNIADRVGYFDSTQPYLTAQGEFDMAKIQLGMAYDVPEVLEECVMGSVEVNCSEITERVYDVNNGITYVVTAPAVQSQPEAGLKLFYNTNSRSMKTLLANTNIQARAIGDGIVIAFGDNDRKYYAPTKSMVQFELTQMNYDRQVTKSRHLCRDRLEEAHITKKYANYTVSNCRDECKYRALLDQCGCFPLNVLNEFLNVSQPNEYAVCDEIQMGECALTILTKPDEIDQLIKCTEVNCVPACQEVKYGASMTFHNLPSAQNKRNLAHLYHMLMYKVTKQRLRNFRLLLLSANATAIEDQLADRSAWLYVFTDVTSGKHYKYSGPANDTCGNGINCITLDELITQQAKLAINITAGIGAVQWDWGTTEEHIYKQLQFMHRDTLDQFVPQAHTDWTPTDETNATDDNETDVVSQHHERPHRLYYYNTARNPVRIVEDLRSTEPVRYDSFGGAHFVFSQERYHIDQYHDIGLQTDYIYEMRQEYDKDTGQAAYSQQCNPSRYVDACHLLRDQVAEQWANDHVLLIIEYQEFEIVFVTKQLRSTWNELIGSIGGNIGLFMGGSIMSLIHMVVSIVNWFCSSIGTKKHNRRQRQAEQQEEEEEEQDCDDKAAEATATMVAGSGKQQQLNTNGALIKRVMSPRHPNDVQVVRVRRLDSCSRLEHTTSVSYLPDTLQSFDSSVSSEDIYYRQSPLALGHTPVDAPSSLRHRVTYLRPASSQLQNTPPGTNTGGSHVQCERALHELRRELRDFRRHIERVMYTHVGVSLRDSGAAAAPDHPPHNVRL